MRRFLIIVATATALAFAQEHAAPAAPGHEINPEPSRTVEKDAAPEHEDPLLKWKWVNFAILAGALGYMIGKKAPAFFRGRTAEIQRELHEANQARQEAEARVAEMERRLGALTDEVNKLRTDSQQEMQRESDRIRQNTESQLAKIQASTGQEIEALTKHAIQDLKVYSAQLAVDLAEQRIRTQMSGEVQNGLVERFVRQLDEKGIQN